MRSSNAEPGAAPHGADWWSRGLRVLRLTVLGFLVVDTSTVLIPLFGFTSMGPLRWSDLVLSPLCLVAAVAVMWRRPWIALAVIAAVAALALTLGPSGSEVWVLAVSGAAVGALASGRQLAAATLGYALYISAFSFRLAEQSSNMWLTGALALGGLTIASIGVGRVARWLLRIREESRERLARLADENAQIRAIERAVLADDLQTVVTGGMTTIEHELTQARHHPEDVTALRAHLDRIDTACRVALTELRTLLGVLRTAPENAPRPAGTERLGLGPRWLDRLRTSRWLRIGITLACLVLAVRAATSGPLDPEHAMAAASWAGCALAVWRPFAGATVAGLALGFGLLTAPSEPAALGSALVFGVLAIACGVRKVYIVLLTLAAYIAAIAAVDRADAVLHTAQVAYIGFAVIPLGLAVRHFQDGRAAEAAALATLQQEQASISSQERGAVARELHDVVAHQLSLTTMLIMGSSASTDPGCLRETLDQIRAATETAGEELGTLLQAMRGSAHTPSTGPLITPSESAQSMAHRLRSHGFDPKLEIDSHADELDATTQRTLTRVLQEATTNILRYAPPGSTCRYTLTLDGHDARMSVVSPLRSGDSTSDLSLGWGLRGIRERVDLSNGTFAAYSHAGHWTVDVTIPIHPVPTRTQVEPVPGESDPLLDRAAVRS